MKNITVGVMALMSSLAFSAFAVDVSESQGVTLTSYDVGLSLVSELRRADLAKGNNELVIRQLPQKMDPASPGLFFPKAEGEIEFADYRFEYAEQTTLLSPAILWNLSSAKEGLQNFRLSYLTRGIEWTADYEVILTPDGRAAHFGYRVGIRNESGKEYKDARIKLVSTGKGEISSRRITEENREVFRYVYGGHEPLPEREAASLTGVFSYELPRTLTLNDGHTKYVQILSVQALPVNRLYVYDGVKFDRFPRNRRNDWNYGTEYHTIVDTCLEFKNDVSSGLTAPLPTGRLRLFQQHEDGATDWLGEDYLYSTPTGSTAFVRIGPARSLRGERERTGYIEVKPLHEYEETFEIRLENLSEETVEIRVVEHLYRWSDYEIVKSDTEFTTTGPQTIEFKPQLKPGGKRSIHYTVRYRW